jgi:hypothetical protein
VQPDLVGDLAQAQRLHRERAVFEEVALALQDRLGHRQDGREALLDVAHRPARFLQVRGELGVLGVAVLLEQLGIDAVQAHLRHHRGIELRGPVAADLLHDHVGHHEVHVRRAEAPAGPRVEVADALAHRLDVRRLALEDARQAGMSRCASLLELLADDAARELAVDGSSDAFELQQQALGHVARADAARVERLHQLERGVHLAVVDRGSSSAICGELLERGAGSRRRRATR